MHRVTKQLPVFVTFLLLISTIISVPAQKRFLSSPASEKLKSKSIVALPEARLAALKNNYGVGETVFVNGSGFAASEPVTLNVESVDVLRKTNDLSASWTVYSDEHGNIAFEWRVPFAGKFIVSAAGEKGAATQTFVNAAAVAPIVVAGNPSCATLNASSDPAFAHIVSNYGFKIEPPASGTFPYTNSAGELTGGAPADPGNSLTISNRTDAAFDFSSTRILSAVIVKGGPNANVYAYNPASSGDPMLSTVDGRFDISHIEVCFGPPAASLTIIKDAQPNSMQSFGFTATGQINQNFALVDNGIIGPDRIQFTNLNGFGAGHSITVTEGASAPFSLTQINCTSSGSGVENNTINVPVRFAVIQLEPGEAVVCTFINSVTTAANVSASGRVTDAYGNPISRASVSIQNSAGGQTRTVLTSSLGYYKFDELPSGSIYMISVSHKRYLFSQGTQIFALNDAVENMDFVADFQ